MVRRFVIVLVALGVVGMAAGCGGSGGGRSSADDLDDLESPIDTNATVPCLRRLDVTVFVNPAVAPSQYPVIEDALSALPGVTEISLVDQQAAYDEFVRLFPDTPGLDTLLPSNLPASFRLTLDDPARAEDIRIAATAIDGVGQVTLPKDAGVSSSASIPC